MYQRKKKYDLTKHYLAYQKGEAEWLPLKQEAEAYCYFIANRFFKERDDQFTYFIMKFFHQIPKLIYEFEWYGYPIEHYLCKSVIMRCKAIAGRFRKKRFYEQIQLHCNCAEPSLEAVKQFRSPELVQERSSYALKVEAARFFQADQRGKLDKRSYRNRMLIFALKESEYIDDKLIDAISKITDTDPEELLEQITYCRERLRDRKSRYFTMTQRKNRIFIKMIETQIKLAYTDDPEEKRQLREQNCILKERLLHALAYLRSRNWTPSHQTISQVIGLPKGTISSTLYTLNALSPETRKDQNSLNKASR